MMNEEDKDERFYRDTESVAFVKLDDRQLALLEPLGKRRMLRGGGKGKVNAPTWSMGRAARISRIEAADLKLLPSQS